MALELVPPRPKFFSTEECEAALRIAELHLAEAAELPLESELRALMLRSATRWTNLSRCTPPPALKAVR
jgi:hypothetical protein